MSPRIRQTTSWSCPPRSKSTRPSPSKVAFDTERSSARRICVTAMTKSHPSTVRRCTASLWATSAGERKLAGGRCWQFDGQSLMQNISHQHRHPIGFGLGTCKKCCHIGIRTYVPARPINPILYWPIVLITYSCARASRLPSLTWESGFLWGVACTTFDSIQGKFVFPDNSISRLSPKSKSGG